MARVIRKRRVADEIRPARRSDRQAVAALWFESDRLHAALHPRYFLGDGRLDGRLVAAFDRPDDQRALLVAERAGAVIGFVLVELLEPSRAMRAHAARRGHIDSLVVAAAARRTGCGRRLVDAAARWARERRAEELLLTVWSGNDSADAFYERLGFVDVSRVKRVSLT